MIRREEAAGNIEIIGSKARRRSRGRVDYTLRLKVVTDAQPVAIALIEAKKASLPPGHGLDQGKAYAHSKRLNVPFVFSSNGHQFVAYDRFTGQTSRGPGSWPNSRPRMRYASATSNTWASIFRTKPPSRCWSPITTAKGPPLLPRMPPFAPCWKRLPATPAAVSRPAPCALLALATGAGKTFIAVNLLKRIADAGQLKRALFLCGRDAGFSAQPAG